MPQIQSYRARIKTTDGREWVSATQGTLTSDDMGAYAIAEAIDNNITDQWMAGQNSQRPFQLGMNAEGRSITIVHPNHIVWLEIELLELRPATPEEAARAQVPTLPDIQFNRTEQPPEDGGLSAESD